MKDREYLEKPSRYGQGMEIQIVNRTVPHIQAEYAMSLMKHFGIVAALPDGEDSAGRQKLRLPTPLELVNRTCEIAEAAFAEFEKRGWLLELPSQKPQAE